MNRSLRALVLSVSSAALVGGLLAGGAAPASAKPHRPGLVQLSAAAVAEDAAPGTEVGVISATDRDRGYKHTFALVSGAGATNNALFAISGDRLQVAGPLDHETAPVLSIRVRVTDNKGLLRERSLQISVTDVDETPVNHAPTGVALSPAAVAEGVWGGTVGTLTATDPDAGDHHTFALVAGAGDADNGFFAVAGDQLQSTTIFDYETKSSYQVRVRTIDAAGATYEQALTVQVTDVPEAVNHAPTAVTIAADAACAPDCSPVTPTEMTVPEDYYGLIGNLTATDPDAGDTHTFTLVSATSGGTPVSSFRVSGNQLLTAHCTTVDAGTYVLTIRATDADGLTYDGQITVTAASISPSRKVIARRC